MCCCSRLDHRSPYHLLDALRSRDQHHQSVEAERNAAGWGHLTEAAKKILVDRIALAVDALLLGHRGLEARALLGGVGQLAERIGKLHPAGIKLEALGDLVATWFCSRQRRQRQRILI